MIKKTRISYMKKKKKKKAKKAGDAKGEEKKE